jgi:hypothetical protein
MVCIPSGGAEFAAPAPPVLVFNSIGLFAFLLYLFDERRVFVRTIFFLSADF